MIIYCNINYKNVLECNYFSHHFFLQGAKLLSYFLYHISIIKYEFPINPDKCVHEMKNKLTSVGGIKKCTCSDKSTRTYLCESNNILYHSKYSNSSTCLTSDFNYILIMINNKLKCVSVFLDHLVHIFLNFGLLLLFVLLFNLYYNETSNPCISFKKIFIPREIGFCKC